MSKFSRIERVTSLKDNSSYPKKDLEALPNLVSRIANKTLDHLGEDVFIFPEGAKTLKDLDKNQMILRSQNGQFLTSNVMGFLGYEDERLVIESRFSSDGDSDYFLEYLLYRITGYCPNLIDLKTDTSFDLTLFNWLMFLFPHALKSALRKGPFRTYVRRDFNDRYVRGTIDVARHIRENTPFLGKVAYVQRQFTADNSLMELIRHTIEYLRRTEIGRRVLSQARDEVAQIEALTPGYQAGERWHVIVTNKRAHVRHSYFREYRALQTLCLLILQHQSHGIGSGNKRVYGILFDGAWLWEEYVNELIGEAFHHPENRKGDKGKPQPIFYNKNHHVEKMYPDFIGKRDRIVADAKYKHLSGTIGRDDTLQILAYMLRFDAETGYLLYPESDETIEGRHKLLLAEGTTYEKNVRPRPDGKAVIKVGLKLPHGCNDFKSFEAMMRQAEETFKRNVIQLP